MYQLNENVFFYLDKMGFLTESLDKSIGNNMSVKEHILHSRIPEELKQDAIKHLKEYSSIRKSVITGLTLHADLNKKIQEEKLPNGFDMGIDKNGYFISTHRCRSKSHEKPDQITAKEIKFVNSTG